jgi:hypothetical protein
MADSQVVLFYSNHCQHSNTFVSQLTESNININMVCVDSTPRHRIPAMVRSVPTLVIAGQPSPLVGDSAFEWLKGEQQRAASSRQAREQQQQQQQQQQTAGGASESEGPAAWQTEEMGGSFSDGYSFLDSHTAASIPKSFAFLDDAQPGSGQPPGPGGSGGPGGVPGDAPTGAYGTGRSFQSPPAVQQRTQDELSQRMESLQQRRDNDIPRGGGGGGGGHMRFEDLPVSSR